jgi:hypothetical protein
VVNPNLCLLLCKVLNSTIGTISMQIQICASYQKLCFVVVSRVNYFGHIIN